MPGDEDCADVSRILIEPFDPVQHARAGFSCGTERLDNFLRLSARKQQKDGFTRIFVAVVEDASTILGYYCFASYR